MKSVIERLREQNETVLPPDGDWVLVRGNPRAPQGLCIPKSHRNAGVCHWDIYYAYNEDCPWKIRYINRVKDEDLAEEIGYLHSISTLYGSQLTWMTLHTPSSEHIRVWAGEVSTISQELIQDMLAESYIHAVSFAKNLIEPLWDDVLKDTVGSLMLDGLSKSEAQDMLITVGEMKENYRRVNLPTHFYRVARDSPLWHGFCEEPEYEAWWKEREE